MSSEETPLPPQQSEGIVRIDNTVRRPHTPASHSINTLLLHLEKQGFDRAPKYLGQDEQNRHIYSFIKGDVGHNLVHATSWSLHSLAKAAQLLRSYHDSVSTFPIQNSQIWNLKPPSDIPREIIAHNDFAPYNCVYRDDQPYALIDFDAAAPASKLWDLAYSAYRFTPLSDPQNIPNELKLAEGSTPTRLCAFLDAYQLEDRGPEFLDLVIRRIQAIYDYTLEQSQKKSPNAQRILSEDHLGFYKRDLAYLKDNFATLSKSLI